ncbi:energy transducer TonB [Derxia gummosa]|uniref:Energy transducer TonB n=1 Tax=Derxia gummosa DSM 723 TaxID=1121388 RepID=A0A8B6XAJ1_9BURK|nr:energy transducer TonB [Derxia gummosa]
MNPAQSSLRPAPLAAVLALHAAVLWSVGHPSAQPRVEPETPALFATLIAPQPMVAAPAPQPAPAPPPRPVEKTRPEPPRPMPPLPVSPAPSPIAAPIPAPAPSAAHGDPAPSPAPAPVSTSAPSQGAPAQVAAAPVSAAPRTVNSGIAYLRPPAPDYPAISKRRGESGVVEVRVQVDANGVPQRAEIAKSSGFDRLDNAALNAVMKALFKPHVIDSVAVPIWTHVPIAFDLTN